MTPTNKAPLFIITPGDPDGIGPEITWKAISTGDYLRRGIHLLCVGARKPFDEMGVKVIEIDEASINSSLEAPRSDKPFIWLLAAPIQAPKARRGGKKLLLEGYQSGWSVEKATQLTLSGLAKAIITGPISKERLQKGGYPYPGHTEMLAALCGSKKGSRKVTSKVTPKVTPKVTMMLANDQLRVSLVTTHVGLSKVSKILTRKKIRLATLQTVEHLHRWWKIEKPRVAVTALNPHAGEAGLFGKEEIKVITPEIRSLQKFFGERADISGPYPADTLFAKNLVADADHRFDAVVCMYHDQGLIPVKLIDFRRTVNVTLGLPIIRTSVDHGVGFDIAKTGKADPSSLRAAIELAIQIA